RTLPQPRRPRCAVTEHHRGTVTPPPPRDAPTLPREASINRHRRMPGASSGALRLLFRAADGLAEVVDAHLRPPLDVELLGELEQIRLRHVVQVGGLLLAAGLLAGL